MPSVFAGFVAFSFLCMATLGAKSQKEAPSLPDEMLVVDIDAPEQELFRIGIPDFVGESGARAREGADILRNDFRLMPGYRVIGPESVRHDDRSKGLEIDLGPWAALGANGVIKGKLEERGSQLAVELRFYQSTGGASPTLVRQYSGSPEQLRGWMHNFGNEVIGVLTGKRGPFGTEIAFARKLGPGRKDVYLGQMDGFGVKRVSGGRAVSMLPAFGGGSLWYTKMDKTGSMYITNGRAEGKRVISSEGVTMAPAICDGRIYFTSTRHGNSEIYSAAMNGSDVRRLTNSRAIDVSPTCGPGGKLAFVSDRHGSPQVFTMNRDGSDVKRVTYRGNHNQTPVWCMDPDTPLIAFSGRDKNFDIFTVNLKTQEYTRITQGQGDNKDPAFSPYCRILAFASSRSGAPGIYLAGPDGQDQNLVVRGAAETVRWRR